MQRTQSLSDLLFLKYNFGNDSAILVVPVVQSISKLIFQTFLWKYSN